MPVLASLANFKAQLLKEPAANAEFAPSSLSKGNPPVVDPS